MEKLLKEVPALLTPSVLIALPTWASTARHHNRRTKTFLRIPLNRTPNLFSSSIK